MVPQQNVKDLWETYNLHVENFYNLHQDQQGVARSRPEEELRAEAGSLRTGQLSGARTVDRRGVPQTAEALHDEWREIGPVANEYKEVLWNRFKKEASGRINKRHQEFFENIKQESGSAIWNSRRALCQGRRAGAAAADFAQRVEQGEREALRDTESLENDRIRSQENGNAIYERFRNACDKFFEAKRTYYAGLNEMEHNQVLN